MRSYIAAKAELKKISILLLLITEKKREDTEQLIAMYEGILSQIKEFTGENDIDRLTAQFVKQEEENFAVFNYVNELNNEVYIIPLLT